MVTEPARDYRFVEGKIVAVIGKSSQLEAFRALADLIPPPEFLVERQ